MGCLTMTNRKFICAGCLDTFNANTTTFYRNKRWCGNHLCKDKIDLKVKHSNYKKTQRKIERGTFRHGVEPGLRDFIKERDSFTCRKCFNKDKNFNLQVHHIVPISNGGNDSNENLILLCYECHTYVHQTGWENYVEAFNKYTEKIHIKN